ncbi:MAG TPA: DUF488 family protein [Polyangiaceae bacterium]|nr:DUF488 family protein [Polyangiaceae bacterium]
MARPARVHTKRWNDPISPGDGHRILVCRYRPRGVRKDAETWEEWIPDLGPSRELHADYWGKHGAPIPWSTFRRRYLAEMKAQRDAIVRLAALGTVTLLCSSACTDPDRCHRTLLRDLVVAAH